MVNVSDFVPTIIVLAILEVPAIFCMVRFYRLRNIQPIHGRFPRLSLVLAGAAAFLLLISFMVPVSVDERMPCNRENFLVLLGMTVASVALSLRVYLLSFKYYVQQQKYQFAKVRRLEDEIRIQSRNSSSVIELHEDDDVGSMWFVANQKYTSWKYTSLIAAWILFWMITPALILSATCTQSSGLQMFEYLGFSIAVLTSLIIYAFMIRTKEVMKLKFELCITILIFGLVGLIYAIPSSGVLAGPFPKENIVCSVFYIVLFINTICFPLWLSHSSKAVFDPEKHQVADFLKNTNHGRKYFQEYLKLEFSVENLLFWVDVEDYEQKVSLQRMATIYSTYIAHDALMQINVRGETLEKMMGTLSAMCGKYNLDIDELVHSPNISVENLDEIELEIISQIFLPLKNEIEDLMLTDPFPRFLSSNLYQEWTKREGKVSVVYHV